MIFKYAGFSPCIFTDPEKMPRHNAENPNQQEEPPSLSDLFFLFNPVGVHEVTSQRGYKKGCPSLIHHHINTIYAYVLWD
jgi:hypothetical protein